MDISGVISSFKALYAASTSDVGNIFNCMVSGGSECLFKYHAASGVMFLCACFITYCFVWSEICRNVSKVDQIWSITPFVYCWFLHFYHLHHNGFVHQRLLVVCVLTTIWGLRLTYNFWRRGGYGLITHDEDYRWPILRKAIGSPVLFFIWNLTFIASYQNLILALIALPAHGVMVGASAMDTKDLIVAVMFLGFLALETRADQEHWNFHAKKYGVNASERTVHPDPDVRNGFYTSGLFSLCRHPNYFAEQSMWVCVYLFSLTKTPINSVMDLCNGYSAGIILLITLFQGSMAFSEGITLGKYPKYKEYQQRVSQCIPFPHMGKAKQG